MQKRLYLVTPGTVGVKALDNPAPRIIRATSQAAALKHAIGGLYNVEVASVEEVANLVGSGTKVEDAL